MGSIKIMISHDAPIAVLAAMLVLQQAGDIVVIDKEERISSGYVYGAGVCDCYVAGTTEDNSTGGVVYSKDNRKLLLAATEYLHLRSTIRIRDGPIEYKNNLH